MLIYVKNAPHLIVAQVRVFLASGDPFGLLLESDGSFYQRLWFASRPNVESDLIRLTLFACSLGRIWRNCQEVAKSAELRLFCNSRVVSHSLQFSAHRGWRYPRVKRSHFDGVYGDVFPFHCALRCERFRCAKSIGYPAIVENGRLQYRSARLGLSVSA